MDYDSSLNITRLEVHWLTLDGSFIGPMNFSISQPITKMDKTETFRFNLNNVLMKKKRLFLYSILTSFFSSAFAENKIVYVDMDYLLTNINIGKKTFEILKKNEMEKDKELQLLEKNLKNEENKILASRNIVTDEQLNKNINEFKKKVNIYSKNKIDEIEKLKQNRNKEVKNLLKQINPIIENYMDNNSISIIIDKKNVYIANIEYDITNKLIEIINKKF